MTIVSIFNNKGGEGKSTVTVGLAEFLAGNRDRKVLVIDLDAQASSSCALLGNRIIRQATEEGKTSAELMAKLRSSRKPIDDVEPFICWRAGTETRGSSLGELAVMVPDGPRMFEMEEAMNWKKDTQLMLSRLKPALETFDFVLVDLPANVKKSSTFCINGLAMSDFILIPTRPSRISLEGLPLTFDTIRYVQDLNTNGRPAILGLMSNATDKRFQQYKSNFPSVLKYSKAGDLPPVFAHHWPPMPALETATDERRDFETLKERFGSAYDYARKVTREFEKRCLEFEQQKPARPIRKTIWQTLGLK
ncbi:MAG: ParA family protein [Planctomycetaceae bacterium]|nr:ParA family protein [Planctomycetaceae bacterium]